MKGLLILPKSGDKMGGGTMSYNDDHYGGGGDDNYEDIAEDILYSMKEGDALGMAHALKAFIYQCIMDHDSDMGMDYPKKEGAMMGKKKY